MRLMAATQPGQKFFNLQGDTSIFPEQNSKFFTVYDKVPDLSK